MLRALPISVACVAVAGCEEHGQSPLDAYVCRTNSYEHDGFVVDGAMPLHHYAGATIVVHEDPSRSATTDAKGAFTLCVPREPYSADVDVPGDALDGVMLQISSDDDGEKALFTFSAVDLTSVLAANGQTFDPTAGIVMAYTGNETSLTGPHEKRLVNSGAGWVEGNGSGVGQIQMFANAPPGSQDLRRIVDGVAIRVEVPAGKILWVRFPPIAF